MSRFVLTRRFGRPPSLSTDETVKLCLALSPDCHFRTSSDVGSEAGLSIIEICYNQSVLPAGGPQDSASAWIITDRLLPRNALEVVVATPRQAPTSPSATPIFEVWLEFTSPI